MSSGMSGCVPIALKYGEQPIHRLAVILSAQKTKYVPLDHLFSSPSTALTNDCLTSKCAHLTIPLAHEL